MKRKMVSPKKYKVTGLAALRHRYDLQIFISFLIVCTFYFAYSAYASTVNSISNDIERQEAEKQVAYSELSKIASLPSEKPVIAKVEDAAYLKTLSSFYANVKKGDFVFIFSQNHKAVIYDEVQNKVINFGPITAQY